MKNLKQMFSAKSFSAFRWQNLFLLALSGFINACGVVMFLSPVSLLDSGVSGTSMLLAQITPDYLTLPLFLVVINVPLFIIGFRRQGALFTFYSIYAVIFYSLGSYLIIRFVPGVLDGASPVAGSDLLLCGVFGGLISGIGSGLTIRFGGAIDGVEVMAVIFAKRIGITVGTFVMIYNVILYIATGIIFRSWTLPLYSIIAYAVALKTIDFIVEGFDRAKEAMIITGKADEVCRELSEAFGSGVTMIGARGYYSSEEKTVVYFVLNRFQIGRMKSIVSGIDPSAFISISEVADVFGTNVKS